MPKYKCNDNNGRPHGGTEGFEMNTTNNNTATTNATTSPAIECWCCGKKFFMPAVEAAESNARLYGRRLGSDYCRSCILDFVENEIADGVRNPDGTRIR